MNQKRFGTITNFVILLAIPSMALADASLETLQISPQSPPAVCPGNVATNVVTVTRLGGGNQEAFLTVDGLPPGATATFTQNPLKFSGNVQSLTTTMLLSSAGNIPLGSNPYSVIAYVGNGNIKTNTASLEVTLCSPGIIPKPNGDTYVGLRGTAGQLYNVQATTNLLNPVWVTLCTTNCGPNNLLVFVDHDRASLPMRFYRLAP